MFVTEKLTSALQQLKSEKTTPEGNFCLQQSESMDDLQWKISIDGYGQLSLPLMASEAESLCKVAHPAQFGWRDQTLLDENVRNTSEIAANSVHVSYGNDQEFLAIIDKVREGLGLPAECKFIAHLHNLLIYSPGQFFAPHQDTEKLEGMVATLMVVLPSPHLGGELIIDHQGEKKTFRCENISSRQANFIAFYADCYHEVKPVTEGYRIALTYNLVVDQVTDENRSLTINNPALKEALTEYFSAHQEENTNRRHPRKLVYLLDHSYTQHSLSWRLLKNSDRLRARTLRAVAEELGFNVYLALAEVKATWTTDADEGDYYRSRRGRYSESQKGEPEPDELIDEEITLSHWFDVEGKLVPFKDTYVSSAEICWTKASNELKPFESEYEGWMGNYGNTVDYWYHRAAIIVWRKTDQLAMEFDMAPDSVFEELYEITKQPGKQDKLCANLKLLAPYLQASKYKSDKPEFIDKLINMACYIQNSEVANSILCYNDMLAISVATASAFVHLQIIYGKEWCLKLLKNWKENTDKGKIYQDFMHVIKALLIEKPDKDIANFLLQYQLKAIMEIDKSEDGNSDFFVEKQAEARVAHMMQFLQAAYVLADADTYIVTIRYIISNPRLYPQLELLQLMTWMDTLSEKEKWGYELLRKHVLTALHAEFAQGLRSKEDWSISPRLNCKCKDCAVLNLFLRSHGEQRKIWPMAEGRRNHISAQIRTLGIQVDVDTERKGSPHKFLLTKPNAIYEDAKKRFERVTAGCARFPQV